MKNNRPVNLSMGQVLAANTSPVAISSILHRISGVVVFLLIPVLLWILDKSLSSPEGFEYIKNQVFGNVAVRFVVWAFTAGLIFHSIMGVKHLIANMGYIEELQSGRIAATVSMIIAAIGMVAAFVWIMF